MRSKYVAIGGFLALAFVFALAGGGQAGDAPPDEAEGDRLKVVIRPGAKGEPSLEDLVIRSADGRLMFIHEWLTRPKTVFFDIDLFGPRPDKDEAFRLITADFGLILGKQYRYLDFEQISAEFGRSSAAQLASISAHRGVYIEATAAQAFDPLDQTFGILDFGRGLINIPW